jgi:hypothetical protein
MALASTRPISTEPMASHCGLPPWCRMLVSVTPVSWLKCEGR